MLTTPPFITVEGPIGVGKTSLAYLLSKYYDYHLLNEMFEENPFLSKFYENIEEWSFQTEMFFLSTRYKQLEDIQRLFLSKNQAVVADYHIFKNLIFSKMTLSDEQYGKYQAIYNILTDNMPKPNVILYLRASLETLQKRISQRGRDIEKNISAEYLQQLSNDYDHFIHTFQSVHPEVNVLIFNCDELDFVLHQDDFSHIISQVDAVLGKPKESPHAV